MQPPARPDPVTPNATVLPGIAFAGQSPGVQYPRAWLAGQDLFTLHSEGTGAHLHAQLSRRAPTTPFVARSTMGLADEPVEAAFAFAAIAGDRAGVVYIDVRDGVRDSYFAVIDQLRDGRPRVRVRRRLGHTYSNYPCVAYNPETRTFGAIWSHDARTTFARFNFDGDPLGAPVELNNAEFTFSNGPTFVRAGDRFTALVRRSGTTALELVEFDARTGAVARRLAARLGENERVIEAALAWDGARYAIAYADDRALSVAVIEATDNGATLVRSSAIADRSRWAGSPSIAFDGRHYVIAWTDMNGQSRVQRTIVNRDGAIVATSLFASSATEHAWFPFVSVSDGAEPTVVISYQLGQGSAYVATLSQ